jgi:hypothetical protein
MSWNLFKQVLLALGVSEANAEKMKTRGVPCKYKVQAVRMFLDFDTKKQ